MNKKKLASIVSNFSGKRIAIIGDLMLDVFVWGDVERISPEAPVPVVRVERESFLIGGAGNVASNIKSAGGEALLFGVAGDDRSGRKLTSLLKEKGVDYSGVLLMENKKTTVKTRVIARHQQVVRVDREENSYSDSSEKRLKEALKSAMRNVDGVVVSDYAKGVITKGLFEFLVKEVNRKGIFLAVDPKPENFSCYKNCSIITPNLKEASDILGSVIKKKQDVEKAGIAMRNQLNSKAVLITRGEEGMSLIEKTGEIKHIPTVAKEVFDVTGAGDTVVGILTLALAAGGSFYESALISNIAAGIVVGEIGTATVKQKELLKSLG